MAKQQPQPRPTAAPAAQVKKPAPATIGKTREPRESIFAAGNHDFIFERQHFIIFGIGLLLVIGGLAAMTGGAQPDPNNWDPNITYSARRITLAPLMMVAGFVVVAYGIFKKGSTAAAAETAEVAVTEEA